MEATLKRDSQFVLDKIFNEKIWLTEETLNIYDNIYSLREISYECEVPKALFDYISRKRYFALLVAFNQEGKIYLGKQFDNPGTWCLPGWSIGRSEDLHAAIRRIARSISEDVTIWEIEPIAKIRNVFHCNWETHVHYGIGFISRVRNYEQVRGLLEDWEFLHVTENELENIHKYSNRQFVEACLQRIWKFETKAPEQEIATNEKYRFRYLVHNYFMKTLVLNKHLRKKRKFYDLILNRMNEAESFIDISCWDSDLIYKVAEKAKSVRCVVWNDVSWSQLDLVDRLGNKGLIHTNHNAVYLPYKQDAFSVAYCGNTLHHMNSREEITKLLESMFHVSKKVIILEIERPKETGLFPYLLNKYWYMGFLKDVGWAYLSETEFQVLVGEHFEGRASVEFSTFRNIQGKYMIAEISKK